MFRISYRTIMDFEYFLLFLQHMKTIIEIIFLILICIGLYQTKLYYSLELKERLRDCNSNNINNQHPLPQHQQPLHSDGSSLASAPPNRNYANDSNLQTTNPSASSLTNTVRPTTSTYRIMRVIQTLDRLKMLFRGIALIVVIYSLYNFVLRMWYDYGNHYFSYYMYRAFIINIYHELLYIIAIVGMAVIVSPHVCQSSPYTYSAIPVTSRTLDDITGSSNFVGNGISLMSSLSSSHPRPSIDPSYNELLLQEDYEDDQDNHHPNIGRNHHGLNRPTNIDNNDASSVVPNRYHASSSSNNDIDDEFVDDDDDDDINENGIQL
jgi:hypothetical protein